MSNYYTPPPEVAKLWQQNQNMALRDVINLIGGNDASLQINQCDKR